MSAAPLRSLALVPRLIFEDAGGWRRALFSVLMFLVGSIAASVAFHRSDAYGVSVPSDVALMVLAGFLPLVLGARAGARQRAVMARPAMASLPRMRREVRRSTWALAVGLGALAALAGAIARPTSVGFGPLAAGLASLALFGFGLAVYRGRSSTSSQAPGIPASLERGIPDGTAPRREEAAMSTSARAPLDGPARLRAASRYVLSSDRRWSGGRVLFIIFIICLWVMIASMAVNLFTAEGGSLLERLEGLVFAPFGGTESAGRIQAAGRDLLFPLAFVPLLALTQHGGLGHLPFSRRTIAALSTRRFFLFGLTVFAVLVLLGFALVGAVSLTSGAPFSERLAPYAVSAALVLAALPALGCIALMGAGLERVTRTTRPGSFSLSQLGAAGLMLAIGFFVIQLSVHFALEMREGAIAPLKLMIVAGVIFALGVAALPRLFRRYYATVSLAP